MKLSEINRVHFIGVGGIGMSALARFFLFHKKNVSGYDRVSTVLTKELEEEGANIHYKDKVEVIKEIENIDLVVYTPAIPSDSEQLNFFNTNKFPIYKRAELLGEITKSYFTIAIAGTHGKTTTSSIIAHLLQESNYGGIAFLGGIATNYSSNVILNSNNNVAVVEADEFDRSFMHLSPDIIVLTSMDADHLDIYGNKEVLKENFISFTKILKNEKSLIVHEEISNYFKDAGVYGLRNNNLSLKNIKIINGSYHFDVKYNGELLTGFILNYPGKHNLLNASAAVFVALKMDVPVTLIKKAIASFKGVKRRFEIHVNNSNHIYIDDYAHHPKEIDALISSVRELFPDKEITGVFQPHLFTRTRDFLEEFCESLSRLDHLILMDIYPARESPISGINSRVMLDKINCKTKKHLKRGFSLTDQIDLKKAQVILTIGAGDIDLEVKNINQHLINN